MSQSCKTKDHQLQKIFNLLVEEDTISIANLKNYLQKTGLSEKIISESLKEINNEGKNDLTWENFSRVKELKHDLLEKSLEGRLVIPEWEEFTAIVQEIFDEVSKNVDGQVSDGLQTLAEIDPELFALSLCTIDGQVFTCGEVTKFPAHSLSKPFFHLQALEEMGETEFRKNIGNEPSGEPTGSFKLNEANLPHNPLTDAGTMQMCGLLFPDEKPSEKYHKTKALIEKGIGLNSELDFDNRHYLTSLDNSARLVALSYYMKSVSNHPFEVRTALEYYFQLSSLRFDVESLASLGATFASGGINPFTQQNVYENQNVQSCLSVLFSCGIYDYSGEWGFRYGVPAKASRNGCIWVVIPNVMGLCIYSPRIEGSYNLSVRGLQFMEKFINKFSFHCFDSLAGVKEKLAPVIQKSVDSEVDNTVEMCYFASQGNLAELKRLVGLGVDPSSAEYDGRTALHLAASKGFPEVVSYLLSKKANPNPVDRWKNTPLDEAREANFPEIVKILESAKASAKN